MPHDASKYLWDAQHAAELAMGFVSGMERAEFLTNELVQAAVERKLEIVGEALNKLRRFFPEVAAEIPALGQAVGMRNILAHEYGSVNPLMVWDTVTNHVPVLLKLLVEPEPD